MRFPRRLIRHYRSSLDKLLDGLRKNPMTQSQRAEYKKHQKIIERVKLKSKQ